jgi:hypothetical protein
MYYFIKVMHKMLNNKQVKGIPFRTFCLFPAAIQAHNKLFCIVVIYFIHLRKAWRFLSGMGISIV